MSACGRKRTLGSVQQLDCDGSAAAIMTSGADPIKTEVTGTARSLEFEMRGFDHVFPTRTVRTNLRRELLGRIADGFDA